MKHHVDCNDITRRAFIQLVGRAGLSSQLHRVNGILMTSHIILQYHIYRLSSRIP